MQLSIYTQFVLKKKYKIGFLGIHTRYKMQKETKNITLTENYIWKGQYGTFCTSWRQSHDCSGRASLVGPALELEAPAAPTPLAPSTSTSGVSTRRWETPAPGARANQRQRKHILLCTHSYGTFNKLHDKKHPYKPIPLITTYLLNPEQPSPFVTIWALITSTRWPKKSLHDTRLCNYTFQKYFIALGGLHPFWCCHLKPALHLHMQWYFFLLFFPFF